MKKIIAGKKYDTETAKKVGYWENHKQYTDFSWFSETLYEKKTGEFFLHGEGNASSKYGEYYGKMLCSGEEIIPLVEKEARAWAEAHLTGDQYEEIFGEVEE